MADGDVDMEGKAAGPSDVASVPWVEKYRPKSVSQVSFQDEVVKTLKNSIETGNLPHLLFYGPPGTGKTSTILALARELYGRERFSTRVMELNASDERGIGVVKEKIKTFAHQAVKPVQRKDGTIIPPFKLIILDEADSLTPDAQSALRRMMETYSKSSRFCFLCNYVSRIIDPLASRCAKYRFRPLDDTSITARLRFIADSEGVPVTDAIIQTLLQVSGGDLRKAITFLQSAWQLYDTDITAEGIVEIAGVVPETALNTFMQAVESGSYDRARSGAQAISASGYAMSELFKRLSEYILNNEKYSDTVKARMFMVLADADKKLVDGASEDLQLMHIAANLQRVLLGKTVSADGADAY